MSSPRLLEPGIFGIFRPVLLLPEGIADRLTRAQLESILAHELCHVKRRDNLAAAIHMIVEATFWFHPLVWWIGARLVEERERACDEEVLRSGSEPGVYAESILQVCKFYLESPLECVAGVTGSDLKKRIESIMSGLPGRNLTPARKLMLIAASIGAIAGPVIFGILAAPHIRAQVAQQSAAAAAAPKWEVASIRPCEGSAPQGRSGGKSGGSPSSPGRLNLNCAPVGRLIEEAYGIFSNGRGPNWNHFVFEGVPAWANSERYTIEAKAENPQGHVMMQGPMMQALLEERFKLKIRREIREVPVYNLTVGKGGPKNLQASKPDSCIPLDWDNLPPPRTGVEFCEMIGRGVARDATVGNFQVFGITMPKFAEGLGALLDRNVIDKTGISGRFDIKVPIPLEELTPPPPDDASSQRAVQRYRDDEIVFSAMRLLGMKLESAKGPGEVFVIEHVERPSDNFEPPIAAAQAPAQPARAFDGPALSFEVASIKTAPDVRFPTWSISRESGRLNATTDVKDLVQFAYGLHMGQVSGGPGWMNSEKYTVVAKAAGPASLGELQQMMRALLAKRFKLTLHRETKELPVLALVVGNKGPKLSPTKFESDDDSRITIRSSPTGPHLIAQRTRMDAFVIQLMGNTGTERIVVDRTGLAGFYDFQLEWSGQRPSGSAGDGSEPAGPTIFTALQEQLGLKLESTKAPVEIIVIDHVEKPSDNFEPPIAAAQAPTQPARAFDGPALSFEVASVKPSKAETGDRELSNKPGRRLSASNATLKMLIMLAYQVTANELSGGPDWLASDGFDIEAKPENPNATQEQFRQMIQKLLEDRFQLKSHFETKEIPIYTLVVGKRAKLRESKGDEPDVIMRNSYGLMTGVKATMPMFASALSKRLERQVVDETGLKGAYNFKLEFTPDQKGSDPDEHPAPPPGDHPSIFTALQEQLGLNLKAGKGPVQVLVIDRAEKPTDNSTAPAAKQQKALHTVAPQMTVAAKPQSRPAPPAEKPLAFEVASIRPCKEGDTARAGRGGVGSPSPGRLSVTCGTVTSLIQAAYVLFANGQPNSNSVSIEGGPAWIKSERYEINAKAEGTPSTDTMRGPMLQALLEDRFKLKVRRETREIPVYALTVAKGGFKLQPLEAGVCPPYKSTAEQAEALVAAGQRADGLALLSKVCGTQKFALGKRPLTADFHGASLDQFSKAFSTMMDRPVIDKTGITGIFDIHLEFGPDEATPRLLPGGGILSRDAPVAPPPAAFPDDPAGGQSIFTAIQQQLGLKLEPSKGPGEFLVIDHVERPTEN